MATSASHPHIAVIDYGIGNLRSAQKALQHLGADAVLCTSADEVACADAVVLPGVGNFGACMRLLDASGMREVAYGAATDGRPFLGICVGMQMLYEGGDESPDVPGLGVLAGRVARLPESERLPQIGWNTVRVRPGARSYAGLGAEPWLYFVHSYAAQTGADDTVGGWADYGVPFVASVERGALWATQFHPEKSGTAGLHLLTNFVEFASEPR